MTLTQHAHTSAVFLATIAIGTGYVLSRLWIGAALTFALGFLWWIGSSRSWKWSPHLCMAGMAFAAAVGIELGLYSGLALVCILSALAAWDLDAFSRRLQGIRQGKTRLALEKFHLRRLFLVTILGLLLAAAGLTISWNASFGIVFILSLLAAFSFGRIIGFLKNQNT